MTDTAAASLRDTVSSFAPHLQILELVDGVEFSEDQLESITHAFFSADCWPDRSTPFLKTCLAAPRLKWLQSASAGGDHPVFGRFQDRGVEVLFTPGGSAPSIAQTVMMMLLALVRGLPELLDAQQRRAWEVRSTVDVGDLRVGIIGMGSIGAEVAKLVAVTGAEVIGVRRTRVVMSLAKPGLNHVVMRCCRPQTSSCCVCRLLMKLIIRLATVSLVLCGRVRSSSMWVEVTVLMKRR